MPPTIGTAGFLSQLETDEPVALVIGNGIHLYPDNQAGNDWYGMIQTLAEQHGLESAEHARTLALTEMYDLIDLKLSDRASPQTLQKEFCASMARWAPAPHHHWITSWAVARGAPIVTTNFDTLLSDAAGADLHTMFARRGSLKAPTDYYPWEKYFAHGPMADPCDQFGIWHINGFAKHVRSIRLGLTHYMGSVARARPWLHGGDKESRLFSEKNHPNWRGHNSWLHIIFNMPLVIFGLQLGAQEVFLRWLLIERKRYFRRFPDRHKLAWYIHPARENSVEDRAKYFLLKSIGIEPIEVEDFDAIYGQNVWRS